MCEACTRIDPPGAGLTKGRRAQRRRIWDLNPNWHCAIVGTCLTLKDLRSLARKLGIKPQAGFPVDYQLHGYFVGQAEKGDKSAKLLNALLDRRHSRAIRWLDKRIAEQDCVREATTNAWETALEDGDIPGPYWAIMSHPMTPQDLAERMYADIHMLSHLVGASNRADIRRLRDLEQELTEARETLDAQRKRHADRMAEKAREIDALRDQAAEAAQKAKAQVTRPASEGRDESTYRRTVAGLQDENAVLRTEVKGLRRAVADRAAEARTLRAAMAALGRECAQLEGVVIANAREGDVSDEKPVCPLDLEGRCILYVGGRKQSVHRYREVITQCNGELLHHDGGLEKSLNELTSAIARADTVVFPCDCVSHSAAGKVKKLCQQQMKSFKPLRSCGLASLMAALTPEGMETPAPDVFSTYAEFAAGDGGEDRLPALDG